MMNHSQQRNKNESKEQSTFTEGWHGCHSKNLLRFCLCPAIGLVTILLKAGHSSIGFFI